jgi:2-desacetyl-2-hydroxyethyl bacteriochlorophyllide A dehydrogenase
MAKRLIHNSSDRSSLEDIIIKQRKDDEVVVQSIASGISMGTERKVALGTVSEKSQKSMRVPYMSGGFLFPVGYGYSMVGKVIEGDDKWLGKRVFLMHPHQDLCIVKKSVLIEIPDNLNDKKATLISNMETALNGYWDGEIKAGEKILIIGFGLIGALLYGVIEANIQNSIQIYEVDPKRRKVAESMELDTLDTIDDSEFDVVYNTAGNEASITMAFKALKREGRLIELSWYDNNKVCLDLGGDFHLKRLKIISSQVSHLPKKMESSWSFKKRKETVVELLNNPWFDKLPIEEVNFNHAPQFFNNLRNNNCPELAYYFKY